MDYGALNKHLPLLPKESQKQRVPHIGTTAKNDKIFDSLMGLNMSSTFDIKSGYYHMALPEE